MRVVILLFVACSPSAKAAESDAEIALHWWVNENEKDFVEVLVLIALVVLALIFDQAWHTISHRMEHTYRYGNYHDQVHEEDIDENEHTDSHGNVRHKQLFMELVNRAGGEFMTLGFLAFVVFLFNQLGGFEMMAEKLPATTGRHLPKTGYDWLHVVEVVHMELFMGMICYFFLISRVIDGSVRKIQHWETLRLRRVRHKEQHSWNTFGPQSVDQDMGKYLLWRDYVISKVVDWKETRKSIYKKLAHNLNINPDDEDSAERVKKAVEGRFSLSAYLAMNVENGVLDSIEVHPTTWAVILLLFALFAVLLKFVPDATILEVVTPVLICIALLVLTGMAIFVQKRSRSIQLVRKRLSTLESSTPRATSGPQSPTFPTDDTFSDQLADGSLTELFTHYSLTEMFILRLLQITLLVISYIFGRLLLDVHSWKNNFILSLLFNTLFAFLFAVLSHFLPSQVPLFLAVIALPPFVDDRKLLQLINACVDDHMNMDEVEWERCASNANYVMGHDQTKSMERSGSKQWPRSPRITENQISGNSDVGELRAHADVGESDVADVGGLRARAGSKVRMLARELTEELAREMPTKDAKEVLTLHELSQKVAELFPRIQAVEHTPKQVEELFALVRGLHAHVGLEATAEPMPPDDHVMPDWTTDDVVCM